MDNDVVKVNRGSLRLAEHRAQGATRHPSAMLSRRWTLVPEKGFRGTRAILARLARSSHGTPPRRSATASAGKGDRQGKHATKVAWAKMKILKKKKKQGKR